MSAETVTSSRPGLSRKAVRRIAALGRAEGVLLRRNRIALLTAVVLPACLVFWFSTSLHAGAVPGPKAATLVLWLAAAALLMPVYYNLVTAMVARREDLVFKRLRTGEATDAEILSGTAAPAVAIAWVQLAVAAVAAVVIGGLGAPADALLAATALVLGTAVFVLLAAVTTTVTRTVELAQATTLPVLLLSFAFNGLTFPLAALPEPVRSVAQALPLTSVVTLLRLGLTGTAVGGGHDGLAAAGGAAVVPVLVLAAWIAAAAWAARRWFRWEPRR
jgi:ABC-2 type transport system permease protein